MNDLSAYQQGQLPDNLEDLAKYTIVGRERLKAEYLELRLGSILEK